MERSYSQIFDIGVVVNASSYCSAAVIEGSCVLECLANLESLTCVDEVYNKHGPLLLQRSLVELQNLLAVQWSPHCAAQLAFQQIVASAPLSLLLGHKTELNNLFETILQSDQPPSANNTDCLHAKSVVLNAATEFANKAHIAREESFKLVLMRLVERVQAEFKMKSDSLTLSTEVQHWTNLLSSLNAEAT